MSNIIILIVYILGSFMGALSTYSVMKKRIIQLEGNLTSEINMAKGELAKIQEAFKKAKESTDILEQLRESMKADPSIEILSFSTKEMELTKDASVTVIDQITIKKGTGTPSTEYINLDTLPTKHIDPKMINVSDNLYAFIQDLRFLKDQYSDSNVISEIDYIIDESLLLHKNLSKVFSKLI